MSFTCSRNEAGSAYALVSIGRWLLCLMGLIMSVAVLAASPDTAVPPQLLSLWRSSAPMCTDREGAKFPGKMDAAGNCEDGDINLFAGLLCSAGEEIGCETVRRSQTADGKWFRSPLRAQTDNLGHPNSFSPDMALGTELYLVISHNQAAGDLWLTWLDKVRPCLIGSGDGCYQSPLLRFCTNDDEGGCTVRPGDAAILGETARYVAMTPPTADMAKLFDQTRLTLLDTILASATLNKPGYSQHLVAIEIHLAALAGIRDARLDAAAALLATKQPRNPFFAYLKEGRTRHVLELTLAQCPTTQGSIPSERTQWSWEREDAENAWHSSMIWDCIFMARLLSPA